MNRIHDQTISPTDLKNWFVLLIFHQLRLRFSKLKGLVRLLKINNLEFLMLEWYHTLKSMPKRIS